MGSQSLRKSGRFFLVDYLKEIGLASNEGLNPFVSQVGFFHYEKS